MTGYWEVSVKLANKNRVKVVTFGEDPPKEATLWLVRADNAGEALSVVSKHESYPAQDTIAETIVRECKRYDHVLLNIPLTK